MKISVKIYLLLYRINKQVNPLNILTFLKDCTNFLNIKVYATPIK